MCTLDIVDNCQGIVVKTLNRGGYSVFICRRTDLTGFGGRPLEGKNVYVASAVTS